MPAMDEAPIMNVLNASIGSYHTNICIKISKEAWDPRWHSFALIVNL